MVAQTRGSQFPLVPMVNVNGLKNQAATDQRRRFSGTPRSFKMTSTKKPTSKSSKYTHAQSIIDLSDKPQRKQDNKSYSSTSTYMRLVFSFSFFVSIFFFFLCFFLFFLGQEDWGSKLEIPSLFRYTRRGPTLHFMKIRTEMRWQIQTIGEKICICLPLRMMVRYIWSHYSTRG